MLKAILFDIDDTLIDWSAFEEDWERIETPHIRRVYDHLETLIEIDGGFDHYKQVYFKRTRKAWLDARASLHAPHLGKVLLETAIAVGLPEGQADIQELLDLYQWSRVEGTDVFPDVVESLAELRETNLKLGLVTNAYAPMAMRDRELEMHGLLEFFPDCRVSAADVGYLKPHPYIFKHALTCIDTAPEETIFVGDNPTADIAGSQSAGMKAIMRVIGKTRPLISGLIVPDAAVNSLRELPAILDAWYPGWRS